MSLRSFLFCDDFSLLFNIQNGRDIFLITEMRVNFEVNTILKIEIFGYIWLEIVSWNCDGNKKSNENLEMFWPHCVSFAYN